MAGLKEIYATRPEPVIDPALAAEEKIAAAQTRDFDGLGDQFSQVSERNKGQIDRGIARHRPRLWRRMTTLSGKTALVTGASRGIGRAIARRLAADGAVVAVHYGSNDAAAAETVDAIRAAGGEAFAVKAELGVDDDVDTLFAGLEQGSTAVRSTSSSTTPPSPPRRDHRQGDARAVRPGVRDQRPRAVLHRPASPAAAARRRPDHQRLLRRHMVRDAADRVLHDQGRAERPRPVTGQHARRARHHGEQRGTRVTDTDMNSWLHDSDDAQTGFTNITALDRIGKADEIADAVAFFASPTVVG